MTTSSNLYLTKQIMLEFEGSWIGVRISLYSYVIKRDQHWKREPAVGSFIVISQPHATLHTLSLFVSAYSAKEDSTFYRLEVIWSHPVRSSKTFLLFFMICLYFNNQNGTFNYIKRVISSYHAAHLNNWKEIFHAWRLLRWKRYFLCLMRAL